MFVLGNFIGAVAVILGYIVTILTWLIVIRALISWVNPDPYNPIVQFLYRTTEPVLAPFRRFIPAYNLGIDISPILVIFLLWFVKLFVVRTLTEWAFRMQ